jgi:acyl-CoA thioester hydrolase
MSHGLARFSKGPGMARSDFNFFHTMRVRYAEIDHQGVVFNAHYLTYLDVGHTEYMRAMDYDYSAAVKETGVDFHLAKATVEYKIPLYFDQEFDVGIRVARLGNSSITIVYEIYKTGTDELMACGEKVDVCVYLDGHQPVRIPDGFRKAMEDFEGKNLA